MKVFRTARPKWASTDYDLFSGEGAAISPGRWNSRGEKTTYCAETLEVSLAEAGFWDIIVHLTTLRESQKVKVRDYREILLHKPRVLVSAEFAEIGPLLVDISAPDLLAAECEVHHVAGLSFDASRRSDYLKHDNKTRRLSSQIRSTGAAGIITCSARYDGRCIAIFPENLPRSMKRTTSLRTIVKLSAASSGSIWDGRDVGKISDRSVIANHDLFGTAVAQKVSVLSFD
jgi:hypothetical protein